MPTELTSGYRLSPLQKRLWLLLQDGSVYPSQCAIQLRGNLVPALLKQAFSRLVERHQILRTIFHRVTGLKLPYQVVRETLVFSWQELDWRGFGTNRQASELDLLARRETERKFDFERGPVIFCTLIHCNREEHVLLLNFASACTDSTSLSNAMRELGELYGGNAQRLPSAEQLVQYAQFSDWNHELLAGADASYGRAHWANPKFMSLLDSTLPFENKLTSLASFRSQSVELQLSEASLAAVDRGRPELLTFLFTSWQVLIWSLTRQSEVVIGRIHSGRDYPELEASLGLFARYLPEVGHLTSDLRFSDLIHRNQTTHSEAAEWQAYFDWEVPADKLTFFPIVFDSEQWTSPLVRSGVEFVTMWQYSDIDRYKLKLRICHINEKEWKASVHFDPGFLQLETVQRYARYLATLIAHAAKTPHALLQDLPIMGETDRHHLLTIFNPPPPATVSQPCIHGLFEEVVARVPGRIAVSGDDKQLSYDQLNRRANQLSRFLRGQGVRREVPVAIVMPRSPEMIVSLLAILKAGGAYVPLDPSYPKDRIAAVLQDTKSPVIITQDHLRDSLPDHNAKTVCIDAEWEKISRESDVNPLSDTLPENLAYIIYTSGSTGQPKGVCISHRNLQQSTQAREVYYAQSVKCFLLLSSFSFDSSVAGIFWTLSTGGTLYVPEDGLQMDFPCIAQIVQRHQVSHLLCLPSLYALFLQQSDAGSLSSLQVVIVAGETCPKSLVSAHYQILPQVLLYNEYGPTENTVWSTVHRIPEREELSSAVSIGRPISGTYVYLLDSRAELVPLGLPGEVCIGGKGLARGYWGRSDLTAERFVPDHHSSHPGERLYKTGDLAAYRANGDIEFLGRCDNQVKVRGHRIELGEIETVLREHPRVQDAVVILREDTPGDQRLIAYLVPTHQPPYSPGRYRLPNGMTIIHKNKNETDYLYHEIFESRSYIQHGIELEEKACVFDVGANIGMFTLFVSERCPSARIYAFEPIPSLFEILRANAAACEADVRTFEFGLSDVERTAAFTYYPRSSMMSTQSVYANQQEEIAVTKKFLQNDERISSSEASELLQQADELLAGRFDSEILSCQLRRLSDVISEEKIDFIHLLKIDVQRAELDVLKGIALSDWDKVDQIVVEAHDSVQGQGSGRVQQIVGLLESRGYTVKVVEGDRLQGTGLYDIYACRRQRGTMVLSPNEGKKRPQPQQAFLDASGMRSWLANKLPEYMVPSSFEILAQLPLLPNGKVDRKALPQPGRRSERGPSLYIPPASEMESQISSIWNEALGVEKVGVDDNFFDLGGHSFLAIKIHHRLCAVLNRKIPLLKLFENPTVRSLAKFLEQDQAASRSRETDHTESWAADRRDALRRQRLSASGTL